MSPAVSRTGLVRLAGAATAGSAALLAMATFDPATAQTRETVHGDGSKLGKLMNAQTQACWSPPLAVLSPKDGVKRVVRLRFALGRDGGLTSGPDIVNPSDDPVFKLLADSALRAVKRCAPFKLPAASYDDWREVIINFDPDDGL